MTQIIEKSILILKKFEPASSDDLINDENDLDEKHFLFWKNQFLMHYHCQSQLLSIKERTFDPKSIVLSFIRFDPTTTRSESRSITNIEESNIRLI